MGPNSIGNPFAAIYDLMSEHHAALMAKVEMLEQKVTELQQKQDEDVLWDAGQVAEYLGVKTKTVYELRRQGRLQYARPDLKKYSKRSVLAYKAVKEGKSVEYESMV